MDASDGVRVPAVRDGVAAASDAVLAAMVGRGCRAAFDELYERHVDAVLRLSESLLQSADAAEDVAQETFIALWRGGGRFSPERGSMRAWLCTIAHHQAVDAMRRNTRDARAIDAVRDRMRVARGPAAPLAEVISRDLAMRVRAQVARLPSSQRESILLAFAGGLSQREVAICTGAPLGTVKSRIRLGMERIARHLDPELATDAA